MTPAPEVDDRPPGCRDLPLGRMRHWLRLLQLQAPPVLQCVWSPQSQRSGRAIAPRGFLTKEAEPSAGYQSLAADGKGASAMLGTSQVEENSLTTIGLDHRQRHASDGQAMDF